MEKDNNEELLQLQDEDFEDINHVDKELGLDGAEEGDYTVSSSARTVTLQKADRGLSELKRWFDKGRLVIDPEWQRGYVWDDKRASRLIESFLIELPVPVIYFAKNEAGQYEVIDGLQRLTAVFNFMSNTMKLSGLEILSELNGKTFNELDGLSQGKLEDATLRTFELDQTVDKELMFLIFERLNTGGVALNDMEIRNCLYRGKLNDLIGELSKNENFLSCVNQQNLKHRMYDRLLILRFLSFYQMTYKKARHGLKRFFNEFLETYQNPPNQKIDEYRETFKKCMRGCVTVFGNKGFRLRKAYEKKRGGEWVSRVNASVFQIISNSFSEYDLGSLTRSSDLIYESYVDLVSTDSEWVSSVTMGAGTFQHIEYSFETWEKRLKSIMETQCPNDGVRLFSQALKEEFFQRDNTCAICGQKIAMISDAAMDHHLEYWKGGQTVPDNARLVHRRCNLDRVRKN